jgi:hypothetical protein
MSKIGIFNHIYLHTCIISAHLSAIFKIEFKVEKKRKLKTSDKLNVISEVEAYMNVPRIEMANHLGLHTPTLSKTMLSREKYTDPEFNCGAQVKKR